MLKINPLDFIFDEVGDLPDIVPVAQLPNMETWTPSSTYNANTSFAVYAVNGILKLYKSLQANNINHLPTDSAWWIEVSPDYLNHVQNTDYQILKGGSASIAASLDLSYFRITDFHSFCFLATSTTSVTDIELYFNYDTLNNVNDIVIDFFDGEFAQNLVLVPNIYTATPLLPNAINRTLNVSGITNGVKKITLSIPLPIVAGQKYTCVFYRHNIIADTIAINNASRLNMTMGIYTGAITRNIVFGGISLYVSPYFPVGTPVYFKLYFPSGTSVVCTPTGVEVSGNMKLLNLLNAPSISTDALGNLVASTSPSVNHLSIFATIGSGGVYATYKSFIENTNGDVLGVLVSDITETANSTLQGNREIFNPNHFTINFGAFHHTHQHNLQLIFHDINIVYANNGGLFQHAYNMQCYFELKGNCNIVNNSTSGINPCFINPDYNAYYINIIFDNLTFTIPNISSRNGLAHYTEMTGYNYITGQQLIVLGGGNTNDIAFQSVNTFIDTILLNCICQFVLGKCNRIESTYLVLIKGTIANVYNIPNGEFDSIDNGVSNFSNSTFGLLNLIAQNTNIIFLNNVYVGDFGFYPPIHTIYATNCSFPSFVLKGDIAFGSNHSGSRFSNCMFRDTLFFYCRYVTDFLSNLNFDNCTFLNGFGYYNFAVSNTSDFIFDKCNFGISGNNLSLIAYKMFTFDKCRIYGSLSVNGDYCNIDKTRTGETTGGSKNILLGVGVAHCNLTNNMVEASTGIVSNGMGTNNIQNTQIF